MAFSHALSEVNLVQLSTQLNARYTQSRGLLLHASSSNKSAQLAEAVLSAVVPSVVSTVDCAEVAVDSSDLVVLVKDTSEVEALKTSGSFTNPLTSWQRFHPDQKDKLGKPVGHNESPIKFARCTYHLSSPPYLDGQSRSSQKAPWSKINGKN